VRHIVGHFGHETDMEASLYIHLYSPYNMVKQTTQEQARIRQMKKKKNYDSSTLHIN